MEGGRQGGREGRRKEERERGRGISCTVYMTAERLVVPHQTEVGRALGERENKEMSSLHTCTCIASYSSM